MIFACNHVRVFECACVIYVPFLNISCLFYSNITLFGCSQFSANLMLSVDGGEKNESEKKANVVTSYKID